MPLFALPIVPSSKSQHSQPATIRVQFSLPSRKRKRRSVPDEHSSEESSHDSNDGPGLTAASTNPLSLTPAEIAQYKLAGLSLDEELPSVSVTGFPHRALPAQPRRQRDNKGKGKTKDKYDNVLDEAEKDEVKADEVVADKRQTPERGPMLRLQHLSVLTTILQRCLRDGDIARASRAWAMLIRTQVAGRGIDLRESGYWGIGAELLIRNSARRRYSYDGSEEEEENGREVQDTGIDEKRWGSAEGLQKAKDYYERLILQHPYKRQFHGSVTALDFWPVMVGCEIYGIQYEQREGLRIISEQEGDDDGSERSGSQSDESEEGAEKVDIGEEAIFIGDQRRKIRRMRRRAERRWTERDKIRQTALAASEKITARMDDVMSMPPYSDSHNMLRLRGMLALYIGDLSVPDLPLEDEEGSGANEGTEERSRKLGRGNQDTERRFLFRQRINDHERGKRKQEQEYERARKLFDRIAREGGLVDEFMDVPVRSEEQEELYDAEEA
jgi:hypothetical protein